jgi:hypothetical protein
MKGQDKKKKKCCLLYDRIDLGREEEKKGKY